MTTASCIGYVPVADRHPDEKQPTEESRSILTYSSKDNQSALMGRNSGRSLRLARQSRSTLVSFYPPRKQREKIRSRVRLQSIRTDVLPPAGLCTLKVQ